MSVCTTGDNLRSSLLPRLPSGAVIGPLGTTKSLAKRSFETAVLQKLKALLSMSAWPLTLSFVDHKKNFKHSLGGETTRKAFRAPYVTCK